MEYQNFDLELLATTKPGHLCARVLQSPGGESHSLDITWPFDPAEEQQLIGDIYGTLARHRGAAAETVRVQEFGSKLFSAVFVGQIERLFRTSVGALEPDQGLRVRLRLPEGGELDAMPWEFLFDPEHNGFLAVNDRTPIVRYLPIARPVTPLTVTGPLHVLVAISSPLDHPRLDVSREWEILREALRIPVEKGRIALARIEGRCTFDGLRDALRTSGTHVFHFVGHGIPGALIFEDDLGRGVEMDAVRLRAAFPSGNLPRLVVLNSCSGALQNDGNAFAGLAQGFMRQGVPAVVAMQAAITDQAAISLTGYFYRELISHGAVDTALTEARLRLQGKGNLLEWGTPVLYMRASSGQLFYPVANAEASAEAGQEQRRQEQRSREEAWRREERRKAEEQRNQERLRDEALREEEQRRKAQRSREEALRKEEQRRKPRHAGEAQRQDDDQWRQGQADETVQPEGGHHLRDWLPDSLGNRRIVAGLLLLSVVLMFVFGRFGQQMASQDPVTDVVPSPPPGNGTTTHTDVQAGGSGASGQTASGTGNGGAPAPAVSGSGGSEASAQVPASKGNSGASGQKSSRVREDETSVRKAATAAADASEAVARQADNAENISAEPGTAASHAEPACSETNPKEQDLACLFNKEGERR